MMGRCIVGLLLEPVIRIAVTGAFFCFNSDGDQQMGVASAFFRRRDATAVRCNRQRWRAMVGGGGGEKVSYNQPKN